MHNCLLMRRGSTLLEVMASMALFLITLIAVLALVASSQSVGKRADYAYVAYNLAKSHIETLRSVAFDDLSVADENSVRLDGDGVSSEDGVYLRSTTITKPYQDDSNLALAEVNVSYEVKGVVSAEPMQMVSVIHNSES